MARGGVVVTRRYSNAGECGFESHPLAYRKECMMKAYVPRILRDDGMIEDVFGNFPDLMKYIKMDDYTRVTQLVEEQRQEIARLREALELYKRASRVILGIGIKQVVAVLDALPA